MSLLEYRILSNENRSTGIGRYSRSKVDGVMRLKVLSREIIHMLLPLERLGGKPQRLKMLPRPIHAQIVIMLLHDPTPTQMMRRENEINAIYPLLLVGRLYGFG